MIQRIQSVYLSLTILLALLLLKCNFLVFSDTSGNAIIVTFKGIVSSGGLSSDKSWIIFLLSGIIILVPVISLVTILLYKKRSFQLKSALTGILLSALLIIVSVYYSYTVCSKFDASFIPNLKMVIPLLLLIFNYLAYRGIRKDDRTIRSYDRLR